jgi:hypothetical protein
MIEQRSTSRELKKGDIPTCMSGAILQESLHMGFNNAKIDARRVIIFQILTCVYCR